MALSDLARRLLPSSPPLAAPIETSADTGALRSAQVDTSSAPGSIDPHQDCDLSAEVDTDGNCDIPMVFGHLRTPKEHAIKLRECMESVGWLGRSVYQGEVEHLHICMCRHFGWIVLSGRQ
jgi:hypothetical protein